MQAQHVPPSACKRGIHSTRTVCPCVPICTDHRYSATNLQHLHVHVDLRARHELNQDRLLQAVADGLCDLSGPPVALAAPPPFACERSERPDGQVVCRTDLSCR